jgi:hypothetical protein
MSPFASLMCIGILRSDKNATTPRSMSSETGTKLGLRHSLAVASVSAFLTVALSKSVSGALLGRDMLAALHPKGRARRGARHFSAHRALHQGKRMVLGTSTSSGGGSGSPCVHCSAMPNGHYFPFAKGELTLSV